MSDQQPPTGSGSQPPQWPQNFDPRTGRPLNPPPAPAGPPLPGPGQPGGESTMYLNYQPSALPPPPGQPQGQALGQAQGRGQGQALGQPQGQQGQGQAPTPPLPHGSPWAGNQPGPYPPQQAPSFGHQPPYPTTDALGRTLNPPPRPRTGRGTVLAAIGLVVVLVAAVATGTFLLLNKDDATEAGGDTSATNSATESATESPTESPSATESASESASPSVSESPSESPSGVPTGTTPPTPTPTSAPKPPDRLKTYGAQFSISEFSDDWNFRLDDVALSTKAISAANYPSCAGVAAGPKLGALGCRFAGQTIQENRADGVRVTTFMLQFANQAQAKKAVNQLKDTHFKLTGARLAPGATTGMWKTFQADKFVVFALSTANKKIDDRLLNRYAGHRAADISGALRFMVM